MDCIIHIRKRPHNVETQRPHVVSSSVFFYSLCSLNFERNLYGRFTWGIFFSFHLVFIYLSFLACKLYAFFLPCDDCQWLNANIVALLGIAFLLLNEEITLTGWFILTLSNAVSLPSRTFRSTVQDWWYTFCFVF